MSLDRRVRTSLVSIGADLVLIGLKVALASLTGSLALAADALHSLSDLAVSGVVLLGIGIRRRQERQSGEAAPVRARRIEAGIAYAVSLLILYAPYEIVTTLLRRPAQPLRHLPIAVVGLLACIAIAYFVSRLKLIVGRESGSPALTADGYHSRMDMLSSIAVLFAVMGDAIGVRLDPIVAGIIAVLIGVTGLELLVSSVRALFAGTELKAEGFDEWLQSRLARLFGARRLPTGEPGAAPPRLFARLGSRRSLAGGATACALLWGATGLTVIEPDEIGVRTRFGAIVESALSPGLHFRLPWPIERIDKARPGAIERVEVGFRSLERSAAAAEQSWQTAHAQPGYVKLPEEAVVLAGDESLVDLSLVVHYRPRDALIELYRARELSEIVRGLAESLAREALATERADDVLTGGRERLIGRLERSLRQEAAALELGIEVVAVLIHDAHPPVEVVPAFRDVFSAREDQLKMLEHAAAHRNEALPAARAKSAGRLSEAEGYELDKRLRAEGDAERFALAARAFRAAPEVTGYRLFIETAEIGLAGKKKIIANPRANRGGYHLWLFSPNQPPSTPARPGAPPLVLPRPLAAQEPTE